MEIDENRLYNWIGKKLRYHRNEQELTQMQVARAIGVRRTSITNIEAGIQKLPISLLFEICNVLKLEPCEILPSLSEIKLNDLEEIQLDKAEEPKRVPPQTATHIRDIVASID